MKMNIVTKVLVANGVDFTEETGYKNGKFQRKIQLKKHNNVAPLLWESQLEKINSEEELLKIIEEATEECPDFDVQVIGSWEYAKTHVIPCVRRKTNEFDTIVKFYPARYEDIEVYYRVIVNDKGSYIVRPEDLKAWNIDEDILDRFAKLNFQCKSVIKDMFTILSNEFGIALPTPCGESRMYVATTNDMRFGGSYLVMTDLITDFCYRHNYKHVILIPSSIHEIIIVPVSDEDTMIDKDIITEMVREVNATEIEEDEQLSDRAYDFFL